MFPFAPGTRFPFRPSALLAPALLLGAPLAAETFVGSPCIFHLRGGERCLLRGASGALVASYGFIPPAFLATCPPALGTPTAATGILRSASGRFSEDCHVVYRGKGGSLHHISSTRQKGKKGEVEWRYRPLTVPGSGASPAAGEPNLLEPDLFTRDDHPFHGVYRDTEGGLVDLPLAARLTAQRLNRPGLTQAPAAGGDPVQLWVNQTRNVFYAGTDGAVWRLWEERGHWDFRQLSKGGATDAPAAGGPLTVFGAGKRVHVVYPDRAARIVALTLAADGKTWSHRHLTGEGKGFVPASLTARDRVACRPLYVGGSLEPDFLAVYRTSDGRLISLRVGRDDVATAQVNAGARTRGVRAESGPVFLDVANGPGFDSYLQYVDEEGQLTYLRCPVGPTEDWTLATQMSWEKYTRTTSQPAQERKDEKPAPPVEVKDSPATLRSTAAGVREGKTSAFSRVPAPKSLPKAPVQSPTTTTTTNPSGDISDIWTLWPSNP